MYELHLYKAQPIADRAALDIEIHIQEPIPNVSSLEVADAIYSKEAEELEEALYESLPGGTYDRLVYQMLIRKASHFKVSHKE